MCSAASDADDADEECLTGPTPSQPESSHVRTLSHTVTPSLTLSPAHFTSSLLFHVIVNFGSSARLNGLKGAGPNNISLCRNEQQGGAT